MEERDFFEEISLTTKAVRYTAVVDSKGKLILGRFKRIDTRSQLGTFP